MMTITTPRILVAGTASGVGKTTVVTGLAAALRRRGLCVQTFKCGPDYIDPGFLAAATGRPCRNLDSWMLGEEQIPLQFMRASRGADVAIIEGVMGLFDGSDFSSSSGSAAHIARLLRAPVILVTDISGAGRSAAATVLGYTMFEKEITIGGVVLNFAGSKGHAVGCAEAIRQRCDVPLLGWLTSQHEITLPERHLGLTQAQETADLSGRIQMMAEQVESSFDLDAILALAKSAAPLEVPVPSIHPICKGPVPNSHPPFSPVLAVAKDEAFSFYYPENVEVLEAAGVTIEYFSPLRGEAPSLHARGVYLGGGYPELHAEALSKNSALWSRLLAMKNHGLPIFGECGGFMVLTEALTDLNGHRWPMAALVPGETRMTERLVGLGYRNVRASSDTFLATKGSLFRGHEFHHSEWHSPASLNRDRHAWHVSNVRGDEEIQAAGFCEGSLLASYVHIHFAQSAGFVGRFVSTLAGSCVE